MRLITTRLSIYSAKEELKDLWIANDYTLTELVYKFHMQNLPPHIWRVYDLISLFDHRRKKSLCPLHKELQSHAINKH